MIHMLQRWRLRRKLRVTPHDHLLADYEVLVRLARRCAYDFSHACDFVEMPKYLRDIDYPGRARMWVRLFAKGNPGKDYRIQTVQRLEQAEDAVRTLVKLCQANDVEIPPHIGNMDCLIPF